ncbi:Acetyltransferase (GNAT) family protein [Gillisia sp. Hel1_33_143]|uniref:GNAT family N-acetyltransferase n=1 Tax=Gillisia sp. Hel1_33_143 TaxID=1336796 RepID=UPI00087BEB0A|nr:GNAT family N-acetyltransferase [Gillisia sp. Hel1_33_143]SDR88839.1 Acetyltransferase (GNAT) family protein [Gillisia sp. Hel1_33_143]
MKDSSQIRLATSSDLQNIKSLTEACALAMQEKGIFQWNEHYPSLKKLEFDVDHNELFVLENYDKLLGIIVLTHIMDEEYIPISWLTANSKNLYIHRLATDPATWGKGYGKKLMNFAEDFARENNYESVRLDTFSQNKRNQRFYEARGYQKLGDIFFPKQSTHPFHCYELVL